MVVPFVLFSLIVDLYLLILTVIAQIFNPTAELAKPARPPTNKANTELIQDH